MDDQKPNFYNQSFAEVLKYFHTNYQGLTTAQVEDNLKSFGYNRLPEEKKASNIALFISQFKSILIYILLIAAIANFFLVSNEVKHLTFSLADQSDTFIILLAVFINVIVGYIQEGKAQRALLALKKIISLQSRVIRQGKEIVINAEQVVPGDIMMITAGDKIPADARLFEVEGLEVNEASLTGESEPIKKETIKLESDLVIGDRLNMIFTGTTVTKGNAKAIVTRIGVQTEIGKIAQMIKDTKDEATPLQKKLNQFSKNIGIVVLSIAVIIIIIGLWQGDAFTEIFTVAVAVAVSALPEGLAVAVTVILALGMQRMLRQQALVRRLVATETLGSTTVICTDKTGTLTEGKMQVTDLITWDHDFNIHGMEDKHWRSRENEELLFALHAGLMCNDAKIDNIEDEIEEWIISGNLTERALLLAGVQAGLVYHDELKKFPRLDSIPFDSSYKYMATLHKCDAKDNIVFFKGAPEKVLERCQHLREGNEAVKLSKEKKDKFQERFISLSNKGLRVLALAYHRVPIAQKKLSQIDLNDLVFIGYVGIKDPLRPTSKETVKLCKQAGVKIVMITGDHRLTAKAIAKDLGLPADSENIMEGMQLDKISDEELVKHVEHIFVYARVSPEHKLRIVKALLKKGEVVAMTGDGINDSPALKAADIGVALGSGTQVAKETAEMVILDDNFKSIVGAVAEGRAIFDNIKKTVLYLISDSFSEVLLIIGSMLMGLPLPLTAGQILWINLVNDTLPNLALTKEPREEETMLEPPRGRKANILSKDIKILIAAISLISGVMGFIIYYYFYQQTGDLLLARSLAFALLGTDSLIYVFSIRNLRRSITKYNIFANQYLIYAVVISFGFLLAGFYLPGLSEILKTKPLMLWHWLLVILISLGEVAVIELLKYLFIKGKIKNA